MTTRRPFARFCLWIVLMAIVVSADLTRSAVATPGTEGKHGGSSGAFVLWLSLEEALALFLRQNLDLLVARLGD